MAWRFRWPLDPPLTPTLPKRRTAPVGRGERELIFMLFKPEFDSEFQVDVTRKTPRSVPSTLWGGPTLREG